MKRKVIEKLILLSVIPALVFGMDNRKIEAKNIETTNALYAGIVIETKDLITQLPIDNTCMKENSEDAAVIMKAQKEEHNQYMYTTTRVNLRKGNSTETEILCTLNPNVAVEVIDIVEGWAYVNLDACTSGYICYDYLSNDEIPVSCRNRWGLDLSKDEIGLLARIVWVEARGEIQEGKEAVVEVVFNRMISKEFGGNLSDVLSSKGQFVSWGLRNDYEPGVEAYDAISNVLNGCTSILDYDYVYFSTTKANGTEFIKIGNHFFGR